MGYNGDTSRDYKFFIIFNGGEPSTSSSPPTGEPTDEELANILTQMDILDATDAGVISTGTIGGQDIIDQNRKTYEWLKSNGDSRFNGGSNGNSSGTNEDFTIEGTVYLKEWEKREFEYDISWGIVIKSSNGVILEEYDSDNEGDNFTTSGFVDELMDEYLDSFVEYAQDTDRFDSYIFQDTTYTYENSNPDQEINKTSSEEETEESPTAGEIPPPHPNADSPYSIYLPENPDIKGSINIESVGLEKKAIINVEGSTKGGTDIKIDESGNPSPTAEDDALAEEALIVANNTLESEYNIQGNLLKEKTPLSEEPPKYEYKIVGKVVDEETQQPMGGVTVKDPTNGYETITEPSGDFTLSGAYQMDEVPPTSETKPGYPEKVNLVNTQTNQVIGNSNIKLNIEKYNGKTELKSLIINYTDPKNSNIFGRTQFFPEGGTFDQSKPTPPRGYGGVIDPKPIEVEMFYKESLSDLRNTILNNLQKRFNFSSISEFEAKLKKDKSPYTLLDFNNIGFKPNSFTPPPPPTRTGPQAIPFNLEITTQEYTAMSFSTVNLDGSIKSSVGITQLKPIKATVEEEQLELEDYSEEEIQLFKDKIDKSFVTEQVDEILEQVKTKLLPAIIAMVTAFGISQLKKLLTKAKKEGMEAVKKEIKNQLPSCPADIEALNVIIDKKNQLTKQLDKLNNGLDKIKKAIDPLNKVISVSEDAVKGAKTAASAAALLPSTMATPIPSGAYFKLAVAVTDLDDLINSTKPEVDEFTFQLTFIKSKIETVINMLNILDMLIQGCAEEIGGEEGDLVAQQQISNQLLESTQQQAEQGSPVITNVNGFAMDVISVDNTTIGGLKRRRAVAKNKAGIIMLKGEPSFSSNDQILINELTFYIKQNDLKAE
jgi:hypothetical protein